MVVLGLAPLRCPKQQTYLEIGGRSTFLGENCGSSGADSASVPIAAHVFMGNEAAPTPGITDV